MEKIGDKQGYPYRAREPFCRSWIRNRKTTKGQMKLSFGMMFSIFLIIIFIAFAIYAILKFVDLQKTLTIKQFKQNIDGDVEKIWRGSQASQPVTYKVPSKVDYVCFVDFNSIGKGENKRLYVDLKKFITENNLYFYPTDSVSEEPYLSIEHIDIEKTTAKDNPFCLEVDEGKIKMILKKEYGDALVTITD